MSWTGKDTGWFLFVMGGFILNSWTQVLAAEDLLRGKTDAVPPLLARRTFSLWPSQVQIVTSNRSLSYFTALLPNAKATESCVAYTHTWFA